VLFGTDLPTGSVNIHRGSFRPPHGRRFVASVFEVALIYFRLALENCINGLGRHIAMLVVIEQGRCVLTVEDYHVDRIANAAFRIQNDGLLNGVAVREVFSEEVNEVLFINLSILENRQVALGFRRICAQT
jgi:hypothetical protein